MKKFKTRTCKMLNYDFNILFNTNSNFNFKVVLEEIEAIEITEEEFNLLMTRKNPFKDYNTSEIEYNAFVIPNKYGTEDYVLYVLTDVCKNYRGFRHHCNNCPNDIFPGYYCITWACYFSENLSSNIYICCESEETDNKKWIWNDSVDDERNLYMYDQLELQSKADESEFTPISGFLNGIIDSE